LPQQILWNKFHIRCAYFTPNCTWSLNYSVLVHICFAFVTCLLLSQDSNITRWLPDQCYGIFAESYIDGAMEFLFLRLGGMFDSNGMITLDEIEN
jgi:hypothetical protein